MDEFEKVPFLLGLAAALETHRRYGWPLYRCFYETHKARKAMNEWLREGYSVEWIRQHNEEMKEQIRQYKIANGIE